MNWDNYLIVILSLFIIDTYSTIISKIDPSTHQADQGQCPCEIDRYSEGEIDLSSSENIFEFSEVES